MPRPKSLNQSDFPYHVCGRVMNREKFKLPMDEVWQIMGRQLKWLTMAYNAQIHAFVLMGNHFHLLISTPNANLSEIMANFMRETSRYMNESSRRINQTYGSRYSRTVIKSHHHYLTAYKYIYRNPVAAGLVNRCESYGFSSLNFLLGLSYAEFPVIEDTTLFDDVEGTLNWLNIAPPLDDWVVVKAAMRKPVFELPRGKTTGGLHHLEHDAL